MHIHCNSKGEEDALGGGLLDMGVVPAQCCFESAWQGRMLPCCAAQACAVSLEVPQHGIALTVSSPDQPAHPSVCPAQASQSWLSPERPPCLKHQLRKCLCQLRSGAWGEEVQHQVETNAMKEDYSGEQE